MNAEQAKKMSLPDLLAQIGCHPVRVEKNGNELWYQSPFRSEKEASFHTSFLGEKWIWNDFGDIGGTVIDFAMRHQGLRTVREALIWLERMGHVQRIGRVGEKRQGQEESLFSFQQQSREAAPDFPDERKLEFIKAYPLSHPVILAYLTEERCIPLHISRRFLKEVLYRNKDTGKDYFAFGMENESGGYEIRVASSSLSFKSALVARDITFFPGAAPDRKIVNVFEGMTDFLSLLVMMNLENLAGDSIIMHSLSSYNKAVERIKSGGYTTINTFLDNDRPGKEKTDEFQQDFPELVTSQSHLFSDYNDLNEALCANQVALVKSPTQTTNYGRAK